MASFGPNELVLPVGNDSNRPVSPPNGYIRYNTDQYGVEMYTDAGWIIGGGQPGTENNPATSGKVLYNAGFTTTGNYWLDGGSGTTQYYIKMDYGGGWINVNNGNSVYSTLLSSGWGTGGSDMLSGGGTGTSLLNANNSSHSQAQSYGCPAEPYKSYIDLNNTFATDFNITEARIKILYVSDDSNVTCGPYWTSAFSDRTIITGTSTQVDTTCNNSPNRYSDKVGTGFTVEFYGTLNSATRILQAWTACGGSFTMRLLEVYVR